jgi:hypothetical protein
VTLRRVLVEISVTEQRYQAVLDVHAGSTVTDVAARFGVSRQAVHLWAGLVSAGGPSRVAGSVALAGPVRSCCCARASMSRGIYGENGRHQIPGSGNRRWQVWDS